MVPNSLTPIETCHGNSPSEAFLPPTIVGCGSLIVRLPQDFWATGMLNASEKK